MKKLISVIVSLIVVAVSVASFGCGGTSVDTSSADIDINLDPNYSAKISIGITDSDGERANANKFIKSFNEKYPNIEVEIIAISGDYTQTMITNSAGGTLPDVYWVEDNAVTRFADNDLLVNLDDVISRSGFDKTKYYPAMMKLGQYDHDGAQMMLPRDYNKVTVIYNKKMFEDAGITPDSPYYPKDNWTYAQFKETCKKLKEGWKANPDYQNCYPVDAMLDWPAVFNSFFVGFGAELIRDGEIKFDSENGLRALAEMADLVEKGYAYNPYASSIREIFLQERAAMWFATRPSVSACKVAKVDFDFVTFPLFENPAVGTGTSGYGIYAGTKEKSAAWALLSHMLSYEGQEAFSETGNAVPSLMEMNLEEDASWKLYPEEDLNHDAFLANDEYDVVVSYLDGINSDLHGRIAGGILDLIDKGISPKRRAEVSEFTGKYPNAADQTLANWIKFKVDDIQEILEDF